MESSSVPSSSRTKFGNSIHDIWIKAIFLILFLVRPIGEGRLRVRRREGPETEVRDEFLEPASGSN